MRSLGGGFQPVGVDEVSLIQLRVEQVPAMIIGRSDNMREKHDVVACQCALDIDTPFIMVNQPHLQVKEVKLLHPYRCPGLARAQAECKNRPEQPSGGLAETARSERALTVKSKSKVKTLSVRMHHNYRGLAAPGHAKVSLSPQ